MTTRDGAAPVGVDLPQARLLRVAGAVDDPLPVGGGGRVLGVAPVLRHLPRAAAVHVGGPDLEVAAAVRAPEESPPVAREGRVPVHVGLGHAAQLAGRGRHQPQVHPAAAVRREGHPLAVGRVDRLAVGGLAAREPAAVRHPGRERHLAQVLTRRPRVEDDAPVAEHVEDERARRAPGLRDDAAARRVLPHEDRRAPGRADHRLGLQVDDLARRGPRRGRDVAARVGRGHGPHLAVLDAHQHDALLRAGEERPRRRHDRDRRARRAPCGARASRPAPSRPRAARSRPPPPARRRSPSGRPRSAGAGRRSASRRATSPPRSRPRAGGAPRPRAPPRGRARCPPRRAGRRGPASRPARTAGSRRGRS